MAGPFNKGNYMTRVREGSTKRQQRGRRRKNLNVPAETILGITGVIDGFLLGVAAIVAQLAMNLLPMIVMLIVVAFIVTAVGILLTVVAGPR